MMERDKLLKILSESETIITQTLGSDFINQANSFSEIGLNKMQIKALNARSNPFFHQWKLFKEALYTFNIKNTTVINNHLLWGIRLSDQLKKTKKIPNISRIIKDIKNSSTYTSACFELETAAEYSEYNIQVTHESVHKTPDILINHNGELISIECKALADQDKKQSIVATEIIEDIRKFLRKNNTSNLVRIKMHENLNAVNKANLLKQIHSLILDKKMGQIEISTPHASVEIDEVSALFAGPIPFGKEDDSMVEAGFFTQILPDSKIRLIKNFTGAGISLYFDNNLATKIKNLISTARKQIITEKPSMVCVNVDVDTFHEAIDFIDNNYNELSLSLPKISRRITSLFLILNIKNPTSQLSKYMYAIPNYQSDISLPNGFKIKGLGEEKNDFDTSNKELTISFNPYTRWEQAAIGNFLLKIYNHQGKEQLSILKVSNTAIRFELITEETRMLSKTIDNPQLFSDKKNIITMTWDKNNLNVSINPTNLVKEHL